jgi:ADP-ribose pyrophosphatase YjhB (NUDIX family)
VADAPKQKPCFHRVVPEDDTHERMVCETCGWVHYENPKIVVGSVCTWEDRILLCRRSIQPRSGYWTIPAGFMEMNETTEQGAMREAREEANADIEIVGLLGVYSIPRIGQVQLLYEARLRNPDVSPGDETSETRLLRWDEIPWDEIAFPSVHWILRKHHELDGRLEFCTASNAWEDIPPMPR